MTTPQLSPAWQDVLTRISTRRSSPILMPGAILALLALAESGKAASGKFHLSDFEQAFTDLMNKIDPSKKGKAWQPFYHLSAGAGLWALSKAGSPADFSDLRKGKPAGASSLRARVDSAQVRGDLVADLELAATRSSIQAQVQGMLIGTAG
jgi:hypothetical protein